MPFRLLALMLVVCVLAACAASPEGTATRTAPATTRMVVTQLLRSPTPPATLAPTPTAAPTHAACPPFTADTALPAPDDARSYIGLHYDTLPDGLTSPDGSMVDGLDAYYTVNQIVSASGQMLWLERNVCHDERGHPYYEIRAVLNMPALQAGEQVLIGTCLLKENFTRESAVNPVFDPAIVAIGRFEDIYQPPVALSHAWRVITATESFEDLPPESVVCTRLQGL